MPTNGPRTQPLRGHVVWFSDSKGYGFIRPYDGAPDVFVHHSGIIAAGRRSLPNDALVEYEVIEGKDQKPQAVNVRVIHSGEEAITR